MKNKTCLLTILLISSILFSFAGCANMSDDAGGGNSSVDIFSSPKTVLAAIDNDYSVSNRSQSARTLINDPEQNNQVTISSLNQNPAIDSENEYRRLSGQVSTTAIILDICKNDIKNEAGDRLEFDKPINPNVTVAKFIEKQTMTIKVEYIEIKSPDENKAVFIYSYGTAGGSPYSFILKCTKNVLNTLDTELVMFMGAGAKVSSVTNCISSYAGFVCGNNQKTKIDYGQQLNGSGQPENHWSKIVITSSRITGHKYQSTNNYKVAFYVEGNYSASTRDFNTSDGLSASISTLEGEHIAGRMMTLKNGTINESNSSWIYNLTFLNIAEGYNVVCTNKGSDVDNSTYKLSNGTNFFHVRGRPGKVRMDGNIPDEDNAVFYELDLKDLGNSTDISPKSIVDVTKMNTFATEAKRIFENECPYEDWNMTAPATKAALETKLKAWLPS